MEDCIFCRIIRGEIPSYKVYEDDSVMAFLDIRPISEGHTLVIPKKHFIDLFEIDEETFGKVSSAAKKIANKMKDVLGVDGVNLCHASGAAAEQSVFHFHMHVIPRRKDDGMRLTSAPTEQADMGKLGEVADKLKIGG